ncbi:MAG TPA: hypothetical protein ACFYD1_04685 [Candidatus Hypogeohydataceae bacterium YC38]|jgi:hypothetical protein|nr:hypothetical protein [Candidatus Brocadiales bacterium]
MVIVVQILGALGGLLVLIAGFVGAWPFLRLHLAPGQELNTGQITAVLGVLRSFLIWSLLLFAVGGIFVLCAFLYYISLTGIS